MYAKDWGDTTQKNKRTKKAWVFVTNEFSWRTKSVKETTGNRAKKPYGIRMLAKQNRLPSSEKFDNSKSVVTKYFRVRIKPNMLSYNRFGFVVSKKVDKRAVVRNRLKRVLRELAQEYKDIQPGKDMLFIVIKNFYTVSTEEIQKTVSEVLKNLNLEQ